MYYKDGNHFESKADYKTLHKICCDYAVSEMVKLRGNSMAPPSYRNYVAFYALKLESFKV